MNFYDSISFDAGRDDIYIWSVAGIETEIGIIFNNILTPNYQILHQYYVIIVFFFLEVDCH